MKRRILWIGLPLAVLALTVWLVRRSRPDATQDTLKPIEENVVELGAEAQQSAGLKVVEVRVEPLEGTLVATGVIAPDQQRIAHVFPLARGIIEKIYVQLGDRVRRGQPLVSYDNIDLGQLTGEYLSLRGGLEKLEAQQQVAKTILDRAEALIKVEGISRQELEVRRAEYRQAEAAVESQRADIARVEEQLHRFGLSDPDIRALGGSDHGPHRTASHNTLPAPLGGVVTKYDVSQGEVVEREKELFTIVDTSTVWVLADIYEKDLGQVAVGQTARIRVSAYPDEVFHGKITYISDVLDPSSRTAKLRSVVSNPEGRLKLEMFATVEIPLPGKRRALAVPAGALQSVADQTVVFVQRDATHFEKRIVEVGARTGDWVEIREGLKPGERVATEGGFYLKSTLLREQISGEE